MNVMPAVSAAALVIALGSAQAFAQGSPGAPATQKSPAPPTEQAQPKPPPKPVEGQITMQSPSTVLASSLIGASVTGSDGEGTAEIKDVIIKTDGTIEGVVIGVGGFLGIGEHPVAVKWDKIQLQETEAGRTKAQLSASKEDLRAAQPFKSKAEADAERQAETQRQQQPQKAPVGMPPSPSSTK